MSLETAVLWAGLCGLQIAQVAHAMASQTTIQPRARGMRIQKLPNHGKQIIQRHEQCLAQRNRDGLLCRGQGGLQPVSCGGCGRERCRDGATCRSFVRSCRTAPPKPTQARRSPGLRPAPSVWSSLACEDGSAWQHPVPNVPQNRSCHEKGRSPRVNVMVRDGTA